MKQPWLSIGMIVKDEIRSIERCLKALQPLREKYPCELVIADTGSTDGTREVAEKYADIFFDFEWINDFAAARNAVMDRCSGEWYFSIDADEYLDSDLSGFELLKKIESKVECCCVKIQNYSSRKMREQDKNSYFAAQRMIKMSTGIRYICAIHECFDLTEDTKGAVFGNILLHHDGYAFETVEEQEKKLNRNLQLLDKELEKKPEDIRTLTQAIESSGLFPQRKVLYAIKGMEMLFKKEKGIDLQRESGLATRCLETAVTYNLSQIQEWIDFIWENYSQYPIVRIDAVYAIISWYKEQKRPDQEILNWIDIYLDAVKNLKIENLTIGLANQIEKRSIQSMQLIKSCLQYKIGEEKNAFETLKEVCIEEVVTSRLVIEWVKALAHFPNIQEARQLMANAVKYFSGDMPGDMEKEDWHEKKNSFFAICVKIFEYEGENADNVENPWKVFLDSQSVIGCAAQIMQTTDLFEVEALMEKIEEWKYFPAKAQAYVFILGANFPNSFYQEGSAFRAQVITNISLLDKNFVNHLLRSSITEEGNLQKSRFYLELLLAAMQKEEVFEENWQDIDELYKRFLILSKVYITKLYNPVLLNQEQEWDILPDMCCFALYLLKADSLYKMKDSEAYIHTLRVVLKIIPSMKHLVEYLADKEMNEQRMQEASPELLELAEKVKAILSQYSPDDPAVKELKATAVYQQVAWLIEQPVSQFNM